MTPQLSVIIPTYKRSISLHKLLDCLENQNDVELEVIVVDQNEPGYFDVELMQKLNRVRCIRQSVPNASFARNNGFKVSTAAHILFLDDDLVPENSFCFQGLSVFLKHSLIKCFVPLVYSYSGKDLSVHSAKKKFISYYPDQKDIFSITETISAAVFFERGYFESSGGFDIHLFDFAKTSEDQEFFLRMHLNKMTLWFVPLVEIFHDETVAGGCELRSEGYWNTRAKCIKALVFRGRIHNRFFPGKLNFKYLVQIFRFSFFNRKVLLSGIPGLKQEIKLMRISIKESKAFFLEKQSEYSGKINFLN